MRREASAVRLPDARLQDPQLAVLDGELDVLHVAVVLLETLEDRRQVGEQLGHQLFERRILVSRLAPRTLGQRLRRADAGDDVLALRVEQELAVEVLARQWTDCA